MYPFVPALRSSCGHLALRENVQTDVIHDELSSLCTSPAATIAAKCSPSLTPAVSPGGGPTRPFSGSGPARPSNRTPWAGKGQSPNYRSFKRPGTSGGGYGSSRDVQ